MRPIALFILVTVLTHAAFAGSRVAVQLYSIQLGASTFTTGVLTALYAALPMLVAIRAGREIDRIGVRAPLLAGTAMVLAGIVLGWLLPSVTTLYFSATIIGTGFMLYQIAIQHAVGLMGNAEERAANFSWLSMGYSTSILLGPLIAGLSIDHFGSVTTFLVLAIGPTLALGLIAARVLPIPAVHRAAPVTGKRNVFDLLVHKQLKYSFLVTLLTAMGWDLFTFTMPIYGTAIGLSATRIGLILATFAAATFLVRLALPWLTRRFPLWSMLTAALALAGTMFAFLPFTDSPDVLMGLAFVLGLGLGSAQPMVMALLHNHSPKGRVGEALGLRSMFINTSQTGLPLFFGALGSAIGGIGPVFWVLAASLLGGSWFVRKHARRVAAGR
jgi:MFS family permease